MNTVPTDRETIRQRAEQLIASYQLYCAEMEASGCHYLISPIAASQTADVLQSLLRLVDSSQERSVYRHLLASFGRTEPWRCAYIGGTFDLLHRGHLALFAKAGTLALRTVVSVNTDTFAASYKRLPLQPLADRLAVLNACRLVDDVVINTGDEDSKPAIEHSGCDVVVHGSDWHRGNGLLEQMGLTDEWLRARGIDLISVPYTEWTSTTQLLQAYEQRRSA